MTAPRVLLVKTSSLGDVVHTLPALTDAAAALPGIRFDWVVEEAFAEIPARHPAVDRVIPVALRRWRKAPLRTWRSGEWARCRAAIRDREYDLVLDAQGLLKSAFFTRLGRGPKAGLDRASAREPLSARFLDRPLAVPTGQHAIQRVRQLFAAALGYALPDTPPDAGLPRARAAATTGARLIFFHGTTWASKHWPEANWRELATLATAAGHRVLLPWGNDVEQARAGRIAADLPGVEVLPRMGLGALLDLMLELDGFVAVDTGLAHLAAAAGMPGVALYGPTDPALTGVLGARALSLTASFPCAPCRQEHCARDRARVPCWEALPPARVWQAFRGVLQG